MPPANAPEFPIHRAPFRKTKTTPQPDEIALGIHSTKGYGHPSLATLHDHHATRTEEAALEAVLEAAQKAGLKTTTTVNDRHNFLPPRTSQTDPMFSLTSPTATRPPSTGLSPPLGPRP